MRGEEEEGIRSTGGVGIPVSCEAPKRRTRGGIRKKKKNGSKVRIFGDDDAR